ncbi:hypothetical protein BD413DRAFT_586769 [Trametes elegans]|nr:hypothetical protein BD413DRAFT_586769 [Trametes elegans]
MCYLGAIAVGKEEFVYAPPRLALFQVPLAVKHPQTLVTVLAPTSLQRLDTLAKPIWRNFNNNLELSLALSYISLLVSACGDVPSGTLELDTPSIPVRFSLLRPSLCARTLVGLNAWILRLDLSITLTLISLDWAGIPRPTSHSKPICIRFPATGKSPSGL